MQANERQDRVEFEGIVTDVLPASMFRVTVNETLTIVTNLSGKMKQNKIRVILSDRVLVEVSPYDLTRGRIIRRL